MRALRTITAFREREDGAILVLWAVALAVILGLVALSFDVGRMSITQTQLQSYTDSVALAAAGELDGRDDAITRATQAAADMIADTQIFGEGDTDLSDAGDYTLTFFSDLPADDTAAPTAVTSDPAEARFVRVTATQQDVSYTFGRAFGALTDGGFQTPAQVGATSIASMTQYACDVTPLMICAPSGWEAEDNIGTMINLRSGGQGAAWQPGNFGFLDPEVVEVDPSGICAGLNGQNLYTCLVGANGPITQCYSMNGVTTEPGQKNGITTSTFNIRFDIFRSTANSTKNDPNYPPAPNVIKGVIPQTGGGGGGNGGGGGGGPQCLGQNVDPSSNTVGLLRDDCFATNSCGGGGRFGNGVWDYTTYVNTNYGSNVFGLTDPTRYEVYLAEIANPQGPNGRILPAGKDETGLPSCSTQTPAGPERRLVTAAVVDCNAHPISGKEVGVPVEEFIEIFLTEPVAADAASPSIIDMWGEVVGVVSDGTGAGATGIFRDVVQLYR